MLHRRISHCWTHRILPHLQASAFCRRPRCRSKPRKASTESKPKQTSTHTCGTRPPQHHHKILEATITEQQHGWLGPLRTANDLNKEFGAGMWRFIPHFLLQQRLRDRLIDNAKKGKQNRFTQCPETIFTITLDWLGVALKCLETVFASDAPNAPSILSQNGMTQEFRSMTSQTPSKAAQCTQPTSEPASLPCGLNTSASGSLRKVTPVYSGSAVSW